MSRPFTYLVRTVAPAAFPVSLAEVKAHLRVDDDLTADDALISAYLLSAVERAEAETRRSLISATWEMGLDGFPGNGEPIRLPQGRVQSVTSITYAATDGTQATWSADHYDADLKMEPARIVPAYNETYPSTRDVINAVKVTYVAGYGDDPADVPEMIRLAILNLAAFYYDHRGMVEEIPGWVKPLLFPYKVWY
jgi:uncharacterized phiE125 gp8 family phage protein